MPVVATFIRLPNEALDGLRQAAIEDTTEEFLARSGSVVADFPHSGYIIASLLSYLVEAKEIDLMTSGHEELETLVSEMLGAACFVFTPEQRAKYLDRLDPTAFSEDELAEYLNAFNETDEPGAGGPMLEGVGVLQSCLAAVDAGSVVVFLVG